MVPEEQLKCNICGGGIMVSVSQAKQHASTSSHELNKSKLEQELNTVRIKNYQNDSSVIMSWNRSCL
ncbi:MAG: hypothetical protein M3114_08880 [Thermoproteota archaeon]|jgi:hypothetical protein|nr:hypothetical protein [Thermoproteota archaeon]MDQ4067686.1 hypothetical protein [Thermoproteota archaeon]HZA48257.1 hypothetical protein [Nitrososphaera sp.]